MPPEPVIELESVCVARKGKEILRAVNLAVGEGEKVVLSGPSGSGKSSVLQVVMGGLAADSGAVRFRGEPVTRHTIRAVRSQVAFIGQEPVLGAPTVREALELPFTFRHHAADPPTPAELIAALNRVGLDADILDRVSEVVSGGEKQRIAVARALLMGKKVFLADEVTSALDPDSKAAILALFADSANTLLCISHDPEWAGMCDRELTVRAGRVLDGDESPAQGQGA